MNLTQNEKIRQVREDTIIIGVDIASEVHYARAFDWRGIELGRVFSFENSGEGFERFLRWINELKAKHGKTAVLTGAEPTGHYWFSLAAYLKKRGMKIVLVNPYHVKQSKEMDDNHPGKTDRKDSKVIAKLVIEGRFSEPYIPEGVYAELRVAMNCRWRILKELASAKNQIRRWLKIYFPEYGEVFGSFECISSMIILREAPLPADLAALGADGINALWRKAKLRAAGTKRAWRLYEAARHTVGSSEGGEAVRMELQFLLDDYENRQKQYDEVMAMVARLLEEIPEAARLMQIRGVGAVTAAGFLAEAGDVRRFQSPRQIQKLAGLAIRENSSGKHKGQTAISRRGRARLRTILFCASIALAAKNPEFKAIHHYYTTRDRNPLKKKQSIVALSCKLIRVFYAILTKGVAYDPEKLLGDIKRQPSIAAA